MIYTLLITQQFNATKTGLLGVGYTLLNPNLSVQTSRSTAGVYELSAGSAHYGALLTFPSGFQGYVKWDTGDGSPEVQVQAQNPPFGVQDVVSALAVVDITKTVIDKMSAYSSAHIHYDDATGIVTVYDPTNTTVVTQFRDSYNENGHLIDRVVIT